TREQPSNPPKGVQRKGDQASTLVRSVRHGRFCRGESTRDVLPLSRWRTLLAIAVPRSYPETVTSRDCHGELPAGRARFGDTTPSPTDYPQGPPFPFSSLRPDLLRQRRYSNGLKRLNGCTRNSEKIRCDSPRGY